MSIPNHPGTLFSECRAPQDAHDTGCKRLIRLPSWITPDAEFSPCGRYRYWLSHRFSDGPTVLFAMKNPSAASIIYTDATVAKCGRLARRWNFGKLVVVNAFAFRATEAKRLLEVSDPVGPGNAIAIAKHARLADRIIVAHGSLPTKLRPQAAILCGALKASGKPLFILGVAGDGTPLHPLSRGKLFVPEDVEPIPLEG